MPYSFEQFKKDLREETLNSLTERERIQVMHMLPVEKRLEEIPAEQRLEGLSDEEVKKLLAVLNKNAQQDDSAKCSPTNLGAEDITLKSSNADNRKSQDMGFLPADELEYDVPFAWVMPTKDTNDNQ